MPTAASLERIHAGLRAGTLWDGAFDWLLPAMAREKSAQYWSPLSVARRAALRFAERGVQRVLDVGAGPGKFCIAAAIAQPDLEFCGIEQRAGLVEAARTLAAAFSLRNVQLRAGDAFGIPWRDFDGFFFFNPFAENVFRSHDRFDFTVELSEARLATALIRTSELLSSLRIGTVVVTYCGLGGPIPSSYDLLREEPVGSGLVRTWLKRRSHEFAWYHLEEEDSVSRLFRAVADRNLERMAADADSST